MQVELLLNEPEHLRLAVGAFAEFLEAAGQGGVAVLGALGLVNERVHHARLLAGHLRKRRQCSIELTNELAEASIHIGLRCELRFELLHHLDGLDRFGLMDLDRATVGGRWGIRGWCRVPKEEAGDRTAQGHRGPYCIAPMRSVVGGILVLVLTACGDGSRDGCRGAASLSPAITLTIVALGAGDTVVGRTPWCESDAPVVGSLLDLDAEALVAANPCVVVVQPPAQGMDGGLTEVAARIGAQVRAWPLATLTDVRTMVAELPAALDPGDQQLAARANELIAAMDRACAPMAWDPARTVLMVQAGDGRLAFGPSTYLGEFLAACGVPNALGNGAWQTLDLEDMVELKPAIVLTIGTAPSPWTAEVAARTGARIVAADDDALLVPSGTLGPSLERVRAALTTGDPAR